LWLWKLAKILGKNDHVQGAVVTTLAGQVVDYSYKELGCERELKIAQAAITSASLADDLVEIPVLIKLGQATPYTPLRAVFFALAALDIEEYRQFFAKLEVDVSHR
jgi:hypothetical protein